MQSDAPSTTPAPLLVDSRTAAAAICAALGLRVADLMPPRAGDGRGSTGGKTCAPAAARGERRTYQTAEPALSELQRRHRECSGCWQYTNREGQPVGYVLRWDTPHGKEIRPVSRIADGWMIRAMPEPRPLYRLTDLAGAKRVFVVEGEKCTDAARSVGLISTTSAGGAGAAAKTDWTPLAGKEVIVLPDNNEAGKRYASDVARILAKLERPATVKSVELALRGLVGEAERGDRAVGRDRGCSAAAGAEGKSVMAGG